MWSVTDFWERGYCIGREYLCLCLEERVDALRVKSRCKALGAGHCSPNSLRFFLKCFFTGAEGKVARTRVRAEDNFWDLVLLVYCVGLGDGAQMSGFDSERLCPLSHLAGPYNYYFFFFCRFLFLFLCMYRSLTRPVEGLGSPELSYIWLWVSQCGCWELNLGPLQE